MGSMKKNKRIQNIRTISLLAICIITIYTSTNYVQAISDPYYDPETVIDGIPVISARSLRPEISHRYDIHRRQSDGDLEEVDDYDDDDQQRGSSSNNHDSYENPAYGESRRSAREGEDIEQFFDRHIGPEADQLGNSERNSDREENQSLVPLFDVPRRRRRSSDDMDDPIEVAASSPLSTIFHTLLNAHKRPIVIETNDLSATISTAGSQDQTTETQSQNQAPSQAMISTLTASSPSSSTRHFAMAPIGTFLSPVAAPSTLPLYGSSAIVPTGEASNEIPNSGPQSLQSNGGVNEEDGGVQEIYIGRQPTLMRHFQSYSPTNKKLTHQSSNDAYWHGAPPPQQRPYRMQMSNNQLASAYNSDYARYPVAASYAHQQESGDSDDGTVVYGLSFGGSGSSSGSGNSPNGGDSGEESSSLMVDNQSGGPSDESSYGEMGDSGRNVRPTSTNQYLSFNPYHQQSSMNRHRNRMLYQQRGQVHPARYHKDPSESVMTPISYGQFRHPSLIRSQHQQKEMVSGAVDRFSPSKKGMNQYQSNLMLMTPKMVGQYDSRNNMIDTHDGQSLGPHYREQKNLNTKSIDTKQERPHEDSADSISHSVQSDTKSSRPYQNEGQLNHNSITSNSDDGTSPKPESNISLDKSSLNQTSSAIPVSYGYESRSLRRYSPYSNEIRHVNSNQGRVNSDALDGKHIVPRLRVKREDADDREGDDGDDDGVWVDDDDDDDNSRQSSDVNETSQEPDDDSSGQTQDQQPRAYNGPVASQVPGIRVAPNTIIGGPHGYEVSPDEYGYGYPGI